MLNVEVVEIFYEYFNQKIYSTKSIFRRTKSTKSVCDNFLLIANKKYTLQSIGFNFLWQYFIYQYQYWHELELNNKFSNSIVLAWIIGKKAFQRFETRDREYDWQIDKSVIIEKYCLNKSELFKLTESLTGVTEKQCNTPFSESNNSISLDNSGMIRKQFLNTERGFAICVEMTTLFHPNDDSCKQCIYNKECRELQRVNYPRIFKQRSNEK